MKKRKWRFLDPEIDRFEIGKTYRFKDMEFVAALLKDEGRQCRSIYDIEDNIESFWDLDRIEILEE